MGQVPSYGIIGGGRVAKHVSHYFGLENVSFKAWSRDSLKPIQESLRDADVILLLVSDGAIEKVIDENPFLKSRSLVHFSGSHISTRAWGAHPLMTFTNQLYDLDFYRKIPFIVEKGKAFRNYFPDLKNPSYSIKIEDKNLYHAMCVLSGNFTTIMWNKMFETLEDRFHIPRQAAYLYLEKITENLKDLGPQALTGPLVRHDVETIAKNLKALQSDPFEKVYRAVADIYLPGEVL